MIAARTNGAGPPLSEAQRFLIQWLSKADLSLYGECRGGDLDALLTLDLAQIEASPPTDRTGVKLTDLGWEVVLTIAREHQPTDDDFADMHHALGRPERLGGYFCSRNYYCTPRGGEQARRFEALGLWDFVRAINDGKDAVYAVNGAGRDRLMTWMKRRRP
jgi:hypothetical protein